MGTPLVGGNSRRDPDPARDVDAQASAPPRDSVRMDDQTSAMQSLTPSTPVGGGGVLLADLGSDDQTVLRQLAYLQGLALMRGLTFLPVTGGTLHPAPSAASAVGDSQTGGVKLEKGPGAGLSKNAVSVSASSAVSGPSGVPQTTGGPKKATLRRKEQRARKAAVEVGRNPQTSEASGSSKPNLSSEQEVRNQRPPGNAGGGSAPSSSQKGKGRLSVVETGPSGQTGGNLGFPPGKQGSAVSSSSLGPGRPAVAGKKQPTLTFGSFPPTQGGKGPGVKRNPSAK